MSDIIRSQLPPLHIEPPQKVLRSPKSILREEYTIQPEVMGWCLDHLREPPALVTLTCLLGDLPDGRHITVSVDTLRFSNAADMMLFVLRWV